MQDADQKQSQDLNVAKDAITSGDIRWNYFKPESGGAKLTLLTIGKTAVYGPWMGELGEFYIAWSPLPKRCRDTERVLGFL